MYTDAKGPILILFGMVNSHGYQLHSHAHPKLGLLKILIHQPVNDAFMTSFITSHEKLQVTEVDVFRNAIDTK